MISAGHIGGIGPESTVDYYRAILASCRSRAPDAPAPSLIINSIDLDHALSLLDEGRVDDLTATPFLDTTLLHVEAVVTRLLAGEESRHA